MSCAQYYCPTKGQDIYGNNTMIQLEREDVAILLQDGQLLFLILWLKFIESTEISKFIVSYKCQ